MIKARFECGSEGRIGPTLGPFCSVQITYDDLRVGPDGDLVAMFKDGGWRLSTKKDNAPKGWAMRSDVYTLSDEWYSDVILYDERDFCDEKADPTHSPTD